MVWLCRRNSIELPYPPTTKQKQNYLEICHYGLVLIPLTEAFADDVAEGVNCVLKLHGQRTM